MAQHTVEYAVMRNVGEPMPAEPAATDVAADSGVALEQQLRQQPDIPDGATMYIKVRFADNVERFKLLSQVETLPVGTLMVKAVTEPANSETIRELQVQVAALARSHLMHHMLLAEAFPLRRSTDASSSKASTATASKRKQEQDERKKQAEKRRKEEKAEFRKNVEQYYRLDETSDTLPCFVLGCNLPRGLMCHAHIYPKAKRHVMAKYLGLNDVNRGDNGIVLAKPLQVAFDEGQFCFTQGADGGLFLRLLNPGLKTQSLGSSFDALFGNQQDYLPSQVPTEIRNMNFGDLDSRPLLAPFSPSKRCLSFHMQIAYSHAVAKEWMEDGAEGFCDYGSDGEYGMKSFLEASAVAAGFAENDAGF